MIIISTEDGESFGVPHASTAFGVARTRFGVKVGPVSDIGRWQFPWLFVGAGFIIVDEHDPGMSVSEIDKHMARVAGWKPKALNLPSREDAP